ncbi:serine/threonine-protein kinase [Streptomyces sp. NPDC086787]|uniref:serine/threonine-protein kinase n=1 Tax=Streptomyces sp. NPDC086787 TaxID=3365759 RepID=UPI0038024172
MPGIPGLLVTGRYRLVESIGQGGMGRVWRAADEMLDRQVAVKEMRISGLDPEDARTRRERVLREARAAARIDHPNVVRIYDVVDEEERLWIVMELVTGRSLERIMAEEGPLGPRETARIGLGLVAALRQVHAGGVLHRDIKPGNVLVERAAGRVVLTDFGIAAIQDATVLTMAGMLVGSPDYMAPERVSGRPQGPPSDIWSLGATLCAALAGRSPFDRGSTFPTLHAVLYEQPELPAAAGPLRHVLAALLHKEPTMRPGLADLEDALWPVAEPPPPPSPPPPARTATVTAMPIPAPTPAATPPSTPTPTRREARPVPAAQARSRGRTVVLAVLGLAAVVAVAAVLLVTSYGGQRGGAHSASPPVPPPASESPSTSVGTPTPSPTVEGTSRPRSLPPGVRREAGGFAWAPPTGWRRDVKTGSEVHYTAPDGRQELVAKSSLARGDLMTTWRTSEQNAQAGRDYAKIRLERTTFRSHPAVVWEYTFTLGGVHWHARLLGFDADGKSYQINTWYQPETEPRALPVYNRVRDGFTVL